MVDATITKYIEVADPAMEVVYLTYSDTNTYTSRKFKTITGAIATTNADAQNDIQVGFATNVATLNCAGASSSVCTLVLFGTH
jgi:hypothetical protein